MVRMSIRLPALFIIYFFQNKFMAKEIIIAVISGLLIITGGIGSILPILPGVPLAYGGLLLYGWFTHFEKITPLALIIFGLLTIITFVIDFVAPAMGAKGYKASRYGIMGSMIGGFLGIFVMGPVGIILGPFIGGFIGELVSVNNFESASKTAWGSFVGLMIGSLFKLAVIAGMLIYFVYALF